MQKAFLALDYGASNGRAYIGFLENSRLRTKEVHRFQNGAVEIHGRMYWDVLRLFTETLEAMKKASAQAEIVSIGIDTWAQDYGLLDKSGDLVCPVYHYRDKRSAGKKEWALTQMSREELYRRTGSQFLPHNTLYQLLGAQDRDLQNADTFLMLPDLLAYWLGGKAACEYTNTTTTQFHSIGRPAWDIELLQKFHIDPGLFPEIVMPGTYLGNVSRKIARLTGVDAPICAVATHDTASAVAALPLLPGEKCWYISMGTWSLVGTETDAPIVNEKTLRWEITNEGGVGGQNRLLKNVTGMWILENMIAVWERAGQAVDREALMEEVRLAEPFVCFIDPNDPLFYAPENMVDAVCEFLRRSGQPVPATRAGLARCVMESIAMKYRSVLVDKLFSIVERDRTLYLIGGGTCNRMMCRFTACALGMTPAVASAESTVLGNLIVQMIAAGQIRDLQEGRTIVRRSIHIGNYEPCEHRRWLEAYEKFKQYETTL